MQIKLRTPFLPEVGTNCCKAGQPRRRSSALILMYMNGTAFFLLCFLLHASAGSYSQGITLSVKGAPLIKVFKEIEKQSGYKIWYEKKVLEKAGLIDLDVKEATLSQVLEICCRKTGLSFSMVNTIVVIKPAEEPKDIPAEQTINIKGRVLNEKGDPLAGASVIVKGSIRAVSTDAKGEFFINSLEPGAILVISNVGYETRELRADGMHEMVIRLSLSVSKLDEVQVIGYGTTTERYNTGTVSKVTSSEIEEQPVTNVLSALSGRAAGVFVQTTNGLPGGSVSVQIRGKGSILAGTDPLYIIDGVPYPSVSLQSNLSLGAGINGESSPFNTINPDDIESISILKDADATAIYGSRGTNGVVLITTKKGKAGKTKLNLNLQQGINKIASLPKLLNPKQYLQIRREAFKNDGLVPSATLYDPSYAPDLAIWDTAKSTDWAKYVLGGTAHISDLQGSTSGGNNQTGFLLGGNYRIESTVLPGNNMYRRGGMHVNIQHTSTDNKFNILFSGSYSADNNNFSNPASLLPLLISLPPDFPLYNKDGSLNWSLGYNPIAGVKPRTKAQTDNIIANIILRYTLLPGLNIKASVGFNKLGLDQVMTFPASSVNPDYTPVSNSVFGHNYNKSIIAEPQLDYTKYLGTSIINFLAGGTWQHTMFGAQIINASGFSNESLMENISSATMYSAFNSFTEYKYISAFARANLNVKGKYIFNATIRKDGSSRFGPGYQFGDFGAVGAAWLFSNEKMIKDHFRIISYGKLRMSYGITGNDQIPDYQYLSTYGSSTYIYQDSSGLQPTRLANANFHWESTKKAEFAVELGFIKDKILLNINRYFNTSGNQLINYSIPYITGFSSYEANLPAVVKNAGWEFELNTKNIDHNHFSWRTSFNLTRSVNILKSFPGISTSAYSQTLMIGEDITRVYGYRFTGVDPATGVAAYANQPGNSSPYPYYYFAMGKKTPIFYGGFGNAFQLSEWRLDIFAQFSKQSAKGGLYNTPGLLTNNYTLILNRWQHPGQQTNIPKSTTAYDYNYPYSSANYFNASYIRLKNVSLSYTISSKWIGKYKLDQCRIYLEGQNLFTWWNKNSAFYDPETGGSNLSIPPMKSIIAGIQVNF